MNRDDRFLRKEFLKNLFPIMFSVLGGTINALIDSIFVSQKLGQDGLAAVNMSMPIYLLICTFGSLVAGGVSVMSARAAGKEDMNKAAKYYHTALTICSVIGILLTLLGVFSCSSIAFLLSQNGSLETFVYDYCFVTILGILPTLLAYFPIYYLQLEGKTNSITNMMIIMLAINISFDYVLMFVMDMGIYGAAAASILATIISGFYGFFMLERGFTNYHFRLGKVELSTLRRIIRYGSPVALGNFVDAMKLLLINAIILHAGGAEAAAVWAVLNALSKVAIMITSGVPQAAAPMTGAYFTARENSGLRILTRLQMHSGLMISMLFATVIVVLHSLVENIFSISESLLLPLICLGSFVILDLICSVWTTFFHATGKLVVSDILVVFRKLLFPIGMAVLLMFAGGYLWLFLPIGALLMLALGVIITGIVYYKQKNTDRPLSRFLLLDDYLEREKMVLDFSIVPTTENICNASEQIIDFCTENKMPSKQTMYLELAIEELLTVIAKKNADVKSVDLRAFALEGVTGIRIRCAGQMYNPFDATHLEEDDDTMMGITMISKMAESVNFTYSLGMNTINLLF